MMSTNRIGEGCKNAGIWTSRVTSTIHNVSCGVCFPEEQKPPTVFSAGSINKGDQQLDCSIMIGTAVPCRQALLVHR